jgi:hypothetical protein
MNVGLLLPVNAYFCQLKTYPKTKTKPGMPGVMLVCRVGLEQAEMCDNG